MKQVRKMYIHSEKISFKNDELIRSIDQLLEKETVSKNIPGVVAIVASNNEILYEGAFGVKELGTENRMTIDTVGYIASMTKPITAVAAMQLVQNKKLNLDSAAEDVLPELSKAKVLEGFDNLGNPILRPPKRSITLRHLLTHTSGFGYEIWSKDILKYMEATGIPSIFTSANASLTAPLLCDPGEKWTYGISIDWAGKMVEAASGKILGNYFKENIFEPLGMSSTSFDVSTSLRSRMARMHSREKDNSLKVIPWEFKQQTEFQQGGGGLYSTMKDYIKFTQMILNKGKSNKTEILAPETISIMSQNQIGNINVVELKKALPEYSNDANFFPNMKQKWGISFLINTEVTPQGRSAGSLAWAGLSNCYFWIDPTKNITGAFMTQIFPFFDHFAIRLFREFEKRIYNFIS